METAGGSGSWSVKEVRAVRAVRDGAREPAMRMTSGARVVPVFPRLGDGLWWGWC